MVEDKAIEEIWAVRRKISEQYGHNTKALLKHYKELEAKYKDRIKSKPSIATTLCVSEVTPETDPRGR